MREAVETMYEMCDFQLQSELYELGPRTLFLYVFERKEGDSNFYFLSSERFHSAFAAHDHDQR